MVAPERSSLLALLGAQARAALDRPAILAPARRSLTYGELLAEVEAVGRSLERGGIGRGAVVALALPNGPDLAVAFLGAVAAGACAPLAPDRPAAEQRRDLENLRADALVVARGHETAARDASVSLDIPVFTVDPGETAGRFTLTRDSAVEVVRPRARDGDAALFLFTSGTTSAPKLVPLTEAGLLRSASNVAGTLELGPADRCLNVMPLFHVHGLVVGLLASLTAGGSVVCTPGFRSSEVWQWIDEFAPTWYTAVPTIHQAMVEATRRRIESGAPTAASLRFVRSSSAALPERVMTDLEELLGVPMIEAYGMTEAAHQIASNPLPPAPRKPGTVGQPTGTEVTVRDAAGNVVGPGQVGDVVIRGPSVASSYLGAPEAAGAAFADGWFQTGDLGFLDDDGYLALTGRRTEIINCGGEKVAPREIDEALLAHPEVEYAVAFAVPHPRLGAQVGAAVALCAGATVTGPQLRAFVAERLAPYKVPRRVVVVDEIPQGSTGKLDRNNVAARLGLSAATPGTEPVAPADELEHELATTWQGVLGDDVLPSVDADFFELGGDSLHANELLEAIEASFGRRLPATVFFTSATVRTMADHLRDGTPDVDQPIIHVQPNGTKPPLFCVMRAGSVVTLRHFSSTLGNDQPVIGLWMPAMHTTRDTGGSVEEIAATAVEQVRATQPDGPYFLFGHSMGGMIVFEIARQLAAQGHRVAFVAMGDTVSPDLLRTRWRRRRTVRYRLRKLLSRRGPEIIAWRVRQAFGRNAPKPVEYLPGTAVVLDWGAAMERERRYVGGLAPSPVVIFATRQYLDWARTPDLGWAPLVPEGWTTIEVPGNHDTMIGEPHIHVLAAELAACLLNAQHDIGRASVSAD